MASSAGEGDGGAGCLRDPPPRGQADYDYLRDVPHLQQVGVLGHGSLGVVVKAVRLPSPAPDRLTYVAVRLMPRGQQLSKMRDCVRREILHNISLSCYPLIVKMEEVFLTPSHLAIVMEYVPGGNLNTMLCQEQKLSENVARWLFQQIILALEFMHRRSVADRDLKLTNLLLNRDQARAIIKVCDFGYWKHESSSTASLFVGPTVTMAPETLHQEWYKPQIGDMWSCGVILHAMLFGRYPFVFSDCLQQHYATLHRVCMPAEAPVSPGAREVISRLLDPDPSSRMTLKELLANPWFLTHLPEGALEANDVYHQDEVGLRQVTDFAFLAALDSVLEQACQPGGTDDPLTFILPQEEYRKGAVGLRSG